MKVYLGGVRYTIKDTDGVYEPKSVKFVEQRVPVSTGGSFNLSNGDTLYINEQWGGLDPWEQGSDEYNGIGLSLASGNDFIAYWLSPSSSNWPRTAETGFGGFWDLNNREYLDGNVIKIYDLSGDTKYDCQEMWYYEHGAKYYGYNCLATICIEDDEWVLTNSSKYNGNSVTLNNGDTIYVSGICCEDGIGIYFTISSGENLMAYYYDNNSSNLAHSSNGWLSSFVPQEGDYINIYTCNDETIYDLLPDPDHADWYDESYISEYVNMLCQLRFTDEDKWEVYYDYS